jgi:hypothetical protein
MAKERWVFVMKISFAIFVLSFFLQLSLMYYYINKLNPQPTVTANYPLSIHGWVVYLNSRQHVSLTIVETVTAISVGFGALIRVCLLPRNSDDSGDIHR